MGGRKDERLTINKELASLEELVECVSNVSRSGVFVQRAEPLPVGSKVHLEFTVLVDGVHTIEGEGEVVRVQDDPPGMGVVFTSLSPASQALIFRLQGN
jgi:hypothetical protein